jgi:acid stress-induced BolA-like protein IbaG/YrbA
MDARQVADLIRQQLPGAQVDVRSDDNTHYAALLVSTAFEGLRPLARHQLVYRALGERMGREIHALSIEAFTPQEWQARGPDPGTRGGPHG